MGFSGLQWGGGYFEDAATGLTLRTHRYYDPQAGRFLTRDPIGYAGGINLYNYTANNPVNEDDPLGLDWLDGTANFSAGWGDTLSMGLTKFPRKWIGDAYGYGDANQAVDYSSGFYMAGEAVGFAHSIAFGVAGGLKAAGEKAAGKEFSHWIPDRFLKRAPTSIRDGLRNNFGRSRANGNYVSPQRHYMHDPKRFPRGWRNMGPRYHPVIQQLDRCPRAVYGAAAGALWGSGNKRR